MLCEVEMRPLSVFAIVGLLAITVAGLHSTRSDATIASAPGSRGEGGVIVWSPDGSNIAYKGGTEERDDVVLVNVTSGKKRLLVRGGGWPSWSPDGARIAFEDFDVFTIKVDGTGRVPVATNGSFPLWSPDGRSILYARFGPSLTPLYVVPATGGRAVRIARDGGDAQWSADGKRIAYVAGGETFGQTPTLVVVTRDGKKQKTLGPGESPSWSPNGREIVFTVMSDDEEKESVFVMSANGESRRLLTTGEIASDPKFSPDGRKIVYDSADAIWIMDRSGSNRRRLTGQTPNVGVGDQAWSPDGHLIAFVRGSAIWIMNSNGAHARQLTRF